uniref:azurin n=1 Tax=Halomonas sp. TaxID=1486246 RepID=UPI0026049EA7|nr:azurin [Halomonas sp.]
MTSRKTALSLRFALAAAALAALPLMGSSVAMAEEGEGVPEECALTISGDDQMQFDQKELSVPSSCETVSLTLEHTGSMDASAMGHNWVLAPTDAYEEIAQAGMQAGPDAGYLPEDDRIIAATDIIGGGESTTVEFSTADLAGQDLTFFCSFPGHYAMMNGTFTVTE